jgi:hypothetical protein
VFKRIGLYSDELDSFLLCNASGGTFSHQYRLFIAPVGAFIFDNTHFLPARQKRFALYAQVKKM